MKRPPIALETMTQSRKRPIDVHPLAQVAKNLLAGLVPVQRLQLGPLLRLRFANEGENRLWKDRSVAVETLSRDSHVSVLKQMRFDDRLKGPFGVTTSAHTV